MIDKWNKWSVSYWRWLDSWHENKPKSLHSECVGGWRNDEVQWMCSALVGNRKGVQPLNLNTSCHSLNCLHSIHSSSFTTFLSPVCDGRDGTKCVERTASYLCSVLLHFPLPSICPQKPNLLRPRSRGVETCWLAVKAVCLFKPLNGRSTYCVEITNRLK